MSFTTEPRPILTRLLESVCSQILVLRLGTLHHRERIGTSFAKHWRLLEPLTRPTPTPPRPATTYA